MIADIQDFHLQLKLNCRESLKAAKKKIWIKFLNELIQETINIIL